MTQFLLDYVPTDTKLVDNQQVRDTLVAKMPAWNDMLPQKQSLYYLVAKIHHVNVPDTTLVEMRVLCTAYMAMYKLPDIYDIVDAVVLYRQCMDTDLVYENSLAHTLHRAVHRHFGWNAADVSVYPMTDMVNFAATWGQVISACSFLVAMFYETDSVWYINTAWKVCADVLYARMPSEIQECADAFRFVAYPDMPEYAKRQHQAYRAVVEDAVVALVGE